MTFQTNPAWLAYEFFELTLPSEKKKQQKLTVKTDIYAFGCVCYEVNTDISRDFNPSLYIRWKLIRMKYR